MCFNASLISLTLALSGLSMKEKFMAVFLFFLNHSFYVPKTFISKHHAMTNCNQFMWSDSGSIIIAEDTRYIVCALLTNSTCV